MQWRLCRVSRTPTASGSAAEELDDDAGEEGDGVEVGFGFGDGYDFGAAACESSLKPAPMEVVPESL